MFTRIQDVVSASSGKLRPLRIMNRDGRVNGRRGCGWRTRIWHGVLVAALMMTALPMGVVHATGMTVTTTADLVAADGFCSLREAISAANLNTAVYECPAGSNTETDVITLANGATYALTTGGYLEISNNSATTDLVIGVSGGGSAEINANAIANRVLHVASGASVEITGVAIRYGYRVNEGAGILNDGTLKLVACTISDNVTNSYTDVAAGGGICNRGTLTLDSSIVRHNDARNYHGDAGYGGGIYNSGVLTIQNGTVIGGEDYQDTNNASYGAGIFAALGSTTTIDDSTIKNNWAAMYGGGIYVYSATMGLSEATVSSNEASSGAGIYNAGTLTIQNGSMVGGEGDGNAADYDGGGVYNVGNLTIDASEVSANRAWQNGGGLLNTGTVTIQNGSAIGAENATNAAYLGGGIYNSGALTVDGSSVSGNLAGEWWGPVTGLGGGLYNLGTLVIGNGSTIGGAGKGNSALVGGGIYNNGGTTAVTGSRILENSAINEGDALYNDVNSTAAASVTGSCIVGNGSTCASRKPHPR